jgi:hypothetical protein
MVVPVAPAKGVDSGNVGKLWMTLGSGTTAGALGHTGCTHVPTMPQPPTPLTDMELPPHTGSVKEVTVMVLEFTRV